MTGPDSVNANNHPDLRRAIRPLLNERLATNALAAYYALHHPAERTTLTTYPANSFPATGYVAVSRSGLDLFRPLVTMRLPYTGSGNEVDLATGSELLRRALTPEQPIIVYTQEEYLPLLAALLQISVVQHLRLFQLEPSQFEPTINVFVTRADGPNGLPRFTIRQPYGDANGELLASAGINWQSPLFADIAVYTNPRYRRQGYGRGVVSALVQHLLASGRTPLYVASEENAPSIELARRIHFTDTQGRSILLEGHLRP